MKKLTHREREKNRDLERRIQAAGVPMVKAAQGERPDLLILQDFKAWDSLVFEYSGGIGIALPLKIVSNMPVLALSAVHIHLDRLPNVDFLLLNERDRGGWPDVYFYERPEMRFDRSEVINHFVTEQLRVYHGSPIRGLLLASSMDSIPTDILTGQILDGTITIFDQFEHEHHLRICLRVDGEIGKNANHTSMRMTTRRRLFDQT